MLRVSNKIEISGFSWKKVVDMATPGYFSLITAIGWQPS